MNIAPLRYLPASHEGRYNLRVHVNPVAFAGKAITGYLFRCPTLERRCKEAQEDFGPSTEFAIFSDSGQIIHIGKGVIMDSIITTTIVDVIKEVQELYMPEPLIPPVVS